MSDKHTVLIATYLEPEFVEQIEREVPQVEVINRPDLLGPKRFTADHSSKAVRTPEQEAEWRALLAQAEILWDFDHENAPDLPDLAPNLKWIQGTSAGIGQYVKRLGYPERTDWIFTTSSGVHARPLAEFCMMAMLMFAKNFVYLRSEQQAHHWMRYSGYELKSKTLGIVGLGKIGREVARVAKAFEMRVVGTRRDVGQGTTEDVDQLYRPDQIEDMLRESDFLVLCAPHTGETEHLITAERIALMPQGAVIINIARGVVIDEQAMIAALRSGQLGGAALDVFATEPLPSDSPLWDMPNVIVSPHSASTADSENGKITALFIDNLKRYFAGQPLLNVLDTEKLY